MGLKLYKTPFSIRNNKIRIPLDTLDMGVIAVACILIKKSGNQTKVPGSTKDGHMAFVKKHASSFTKIRSRRIVNVKGRILFFETY